MKIGILTFHSQLNYGGVLQCWALVQALRGLGHDVVVVDRWLDADNGRLVGPFGRANLRTWLGIIKGSIVCRSMRHWLMRHARTIRFVRSLGLTPYHFYDWKDAPKDLGVDLLVVGSDQVWHGGDWGNPEVYLLDGAPKVKAIAYAASFGMKSLPPGINYADGFRRFSAISVREKEGVDLVRSLGFEATHVVDPTLLLPREGWRKLGAWKKKNKRLVCYFLSQPVEVALPELCAWAEQECGTVEILSDGYYNVKPSSKRVKLCDGYGPKEFVRAFAEAEMCITDSFHAVMFSSIFNCNVRFLRPDTGMRKMMFARIEEFAKTCINGEIVSNTVASAVQSLSNDSAISFNYAAIDNMRGVSVEWLQRALS